MSTLTKGPALPSFEKETAYDEFNMPAGKESIIC